MLEQNLYEHLILMPLELLVCLTDSRNTSLQKQRSDCISHNKLQRTQLWTVTSYDSFTFQSSRVHAITIWWQSSSSSSLFVDSLSAGPITGSTHPPSHVTNQKCFCVYKNNQSKPSLKLHIRVDGFHNKLCTVHKVAFILHWLLKE